MIVPSPRLLALWAAAVLPLATAAGLFPAARAAALATMAAIVALAIADALGGRRGAARIEVGLEPVVRLTCGRPAAIRVVLRRSPAASRSTVVRLAPEGGDRLDWDPEELEVVWPAGALDARIEWRVRARERGRDRIRAVRVESPSPLGAWGVRRRVEVDCELRAYPDLGEPARKVAVRLWRRGAPGMHVARQIGRGREFDRLRDYVPGDPLDEIHWKATAKRGRPVSKVFRVERTQEVYVALDRSRLSGRRVDGEPALEASLRAALVLGVACRRFGDLFGVISFSDRVDRFVRAGAGRAHFNACRDALYDGHPRAVAPDYAELATFLRSRLRRRALVVVLTDLEDPVHAAAFLRAARVVASRHLVVTVGVKPPGVEPLFGAPAADLAQVYERLAGHRRWRRLEELRRALARAGIGLHLATAPGLVAETVGRYVEVKARQLL